MLHQCLIGRFAQLNVGRTGAVWEITAGFASKAARKRSRQADVQPFTKVLLQFHDHVMSPNLQLNAAATAVNEKSLTKLLDFVKTLASATSTYPPAMAEPITIMVRDPASGKPRTASTLLRTTGGDCSQSVARSLGALFASAGAPSAFHWDDGMWILSNKKADETDVQAARAKAAAAGIPSSEPMTLDELEAVQAKMDAKRRVTPSGKFSAGEQFLTRPHVAAQPSSAGTAHLADAWSDASTAGNGRPDEGASDATHASDVSRSETSSAQSVWASASDTVSDAADRHSRAATEDSSLSSSYDGEEASGADMANVTEIADQDLDESQIAELRAELQKLDPLLAALAAVPWIDPNAEDGQRVPFIKSTVLDQVEGMGWDVRGGVMKIWAGERDVDQVVLGKDAGSSIALKTVMQYALKFEQDFGSKAL